MFLRMMMIFDDTKVTKPTLPALDLRCRKGGYSEVLLIDGPTPTSSYTPLRCRHERQCPRGSKCVGNGRGEGSCCRGRNESSSDKPGVCPVVSNPQC